MGSVSRSRSIAVVLSASLLAGAAVPAVAQQTDRSKILPVQEVRTVYAEDLDIGAISGLSYDAASGDLLVIEDGPSGPLVHRLDSDENVAATNRPRSGDIVQRGDLTAVNPHDGLTYSWDSANGTIRAADEDQKPVNRYDISNLGVSAPTALVFAPSSDPTDDPSAMNLFVASGSEDGSSTSVMEVSLAQVAPLAAPTDSATLVRLTETSRFSPGSPDPAGVAWENGADQLIIVDSEVDETTGAGWHDVNLWRTSRNGTQRGVGALAGPNSAIYDGKRGYSEEPTGAEYDPASDTLFVSDDRTRRIYVIKRPAGAEFGTNKDLVGAIDAANYGSTDTEDPTLESTTGDLFFLDGVGREIYRVRSVDGVFGNSNDTMTHFDISHLGPTDFEGLTSAPGKGTLYVGARTTKQIFEISFTGALIRTIDLSGISNLKYISGLGVAPSTATSGQMSLFVVDRGVDNGSNSNENDGRLFEISAPNVGGSAPGNRQPVAQNDSASTSKATSVIIDVLANDSDPDGDPLAVANLTQPANGSVTLRANQTVSFTPNGDWTGSTTFTYEASDGKATSNTATVAVTVADGATTSFVATSERSVRGQITLNDYRATTNDDNVVEEIQEEYFSRRRTYRLDHKWRFPVTPGASLTFVLRAHTTGEPIEFSYSTGRGWTPLTTVSSTSETGVVISIPTTSAKTIQVRALDTSRGRGDSDADSLTIDQMVFRTSP